MKKNRFPDTLYQLASPAAVILLGLVLLICPDTAPFLVARILGWLLAVSGICFGICAIFGRKQAFKRGLTAVVFICVGGWIAANPLALAAWACRMMGLLIAVRGIRDLLLCSSRGYSSLLALITIAVGAMLILLPLTTSRLIISLCGIIVLAIGVMTLLDRLKNMGRLPKGRDKIIDADEDSFF